MKAPSFNTARSRGTSNMNVSGLLSKRRGFPPVKFVQTTTTPKLDRLVDTTTRWLESINARQFSAVDELLAENCVSHEDSMFILQPATGRAAIRNVWKDWLRSIPDYQVEVVDVAAAPETSDAFVLWRASGMAKLPLVRQRPTTNKPFEHYGVTRLHFDDNGLITDQWTWRGATADEAEWLLTRSYKSFAFDYQSDFDGTYSAAGPSGHQEAAVRAAAVRFRDVFGGGVAPDDAQLENVLAPNYYCQEATGVWRAMNLANPPAATSYCHARQQEVLGRPFWHAEALSNNGRLMFVHFQNLMTSRRSGTLVGLMSGILVHEFDQRQQIKRTLIFRGPMSLAERSEYFNMDCRACGRSQAEQLGVASSYLSQL